LGQAIPLSSLDFQKPSKGYFRGPVSFISLRPTPLQNTPFLLKRAFSHSFPFWASFEVTHPLSHFFRSLHSLIPFPSVREVPNFALRDPARSPNNFDSAGYLSFLTPPHASRFPQPKKRHFPVVTPPRGLPLRTRNSAPMFLLPKTPFSFPTFRKTFRLWNSCLNPQKKAYFSGGSLSHFPPFVVCFFPPAIFVTTPYAASSGKDSRDVCSFPPPRSPRPKTVLILLLPQPSFFFYTPKKEPVGHFFDKPIQQAETQLLSMLGSSLPPPRCPSHRKT